MDNYNITSEGAPRAQGRGGEGAGNRLAASGRNLVDLVDSAERNNLLDLQDFAKAQPSRRIKNALPQAAEIS